MAARGRAPKLGDTARAYGRFIAALVKRGCTLCPGCGEYGNQGAPTPTMGTHVCIAFASPVYKHDETVAEVAA